MDFVGNVSGEGRLVLAIVEDPEARDTLSVGLEAEAYRVRFALTPPRESAILAADGVDCLVLDMALLGAETAQIASHLRSQGSTVSILVLAGPPEQGDVFEAIRAGADDFIRKPIQGPEHIALAMRRLSAFRSCILDNYRLRIEREKARQDELMNQDRLKFFRFASHELKSPLVALRSSLQAYVELSSAAQSEASRREFLDRALARADQMLDMVNDLTALSADRSDIRDYYQETDLGQILKDAINVVSPVIAAKKLSLETYIPAGPVVALCNRYGIEKVAANLMSNACRYTLPGGRITVTLREDQGHAMLRFTDTGIGVPEEERERIFQEFYRARNARSVVSFGSGLGLALVKKVVHEHGGWIDLESTVGKGSVFTVWIPVRRPKAV